MNLEVRVRSQALRLLRVSGWKPDANLRLPSDLRIASRCIDNRLSAGDAHAVSSS